MLKLENPPSIPFPRLLQKNMEVLRPFIQENFRPDIDQPISFWLAAYRVSDEFKDFTHGFPHQTLGIYLMAQAEEVLEMNPPKEGGENNTFENAMACFSAIVGIHAYTIAYNRLRKLSGPTYPKFEDMFDIISLAGVQNENQEVCRDYVVELRNKWGIATPPASDQHNQLKAMNNFVQSFASSARNISSEKIKFSHGYEATFLGARTKDIDKLIPDYTNMHYFNSAVGGTTLDIEDMAEDFFNPKRASRIGDIPFLTEGIMNVVTANCNDNDHPIIQSIGTALISSETLKREPLTFSEKQQIADENIEGPIRWKELLRELHDIGVKDPPVLPIFATNVDEVAVNQMNNDLLLTRNDLKEVTRIARKQVFETQESLSFDQIFHIMNEVRKTK